MTRTDIFNSLKDILWQIRPSIDQSQVSEDSQLVRDLGLDSLTVMLLSLAIENKYGFRFEGAPQFKSVGEVIDHIEKVCQ
jgi:acyl carrier protein